MRNGSLMPEQSGQEQVAPRGGDRRQGDRRRVDRRTPPPWWRRPWALVTYGVVGALVLVLALHELGGESAKAAGPARASADAPAPVAADVEVVPAPAASTAPIDAYGVGAFERLLAQGPAAVGQRVRTELYCESINPVALRDGIPVSAAVAPLVDSSHRVAAAECTWGRGPDAPDVLLVVPPGLATRFASAPMVTVGFVRRRRVRAQVEWVGRSEALALRNVGVLRGFSTTQH